MTELNELEWELGGLLLSTDPYSVSITGDEGIDDSAQLESESEDGGIDGVSSGELHLRDRAVSIHGKIRVLAGTTDDELSASLAQAKDYLKAVTVPLPNRHAYRLLRWRRQGELTRRLWVKPAPGVPLEMTANEEALKFRRPEWTIHLVADSPVITSDVEHTQAYTLSAGSVNHTIVNAGVFCADYPSPWSLTYVATTDTAGLWIRHQDYTDENVYLDRTIAAGQTFTLNNLREAVLDGVRVDGYIRPISNTACNWPMLRPGNNSIQLRVASGAGTGTLAWRDTW